LLGTLLNIEALGRRECGVGKGTQRELTSNLSACVKEK
jgi:hypothetical protein